MLREVVGHIWTSADYHAAIASFAVGFFGNFAYSGGAWVGEKPKGEPWLVIDIHDSDIATVDYAPATGGASGRFYLGVEPRIYFEDNKANAPVGSRGDPSSGSSQDRR